MMKLFGNFEVVKFPEENMIFITHNGILLYYYSFNYQRWSKYQNSGNNRITVANYSYVTQAELTNAMKGVLPKKETDFLRLCPPDQLSAWDFLRLLHEDYSLLMADLSIRDAITRTLRESEFPHKTYEKLEQLLSNATETKQNTSQVLTEVKTLSLFLLGRDVFRREIGIIDGHNGSSYFWIHPVRVIDKKNTAALDSVAEMRSAEISIEEDDVARYLAPFFYQHFDETLPENEKRQDACGFEWNLEHNFFTQDSMMQILRDIRQTVAAMADGKQTDYTKKLELGADEIALVVDFYQRFLYRMEYMMKIGKEKGYNLISVMGP